MANHYLAIGFEVTDESSFGTLLDRTANEGEEMLVPDGRIICWSPVEGAQNWLMVDDEWNFRGCNPHFAGRSRLPVAITALHEQGDYWEGSAHAWANPQRDDESGGEYPFLFQVADFPAFKSSIQLPVRTEAQIAAFAHELQLFSTEDEFRASQSGDVKFATQSFIPSGLFDGEDEPQPYAMFTGTILSYKRIVNTAYDLAFHHIEVETLGGTFDVVAEDEMISSEPVIGGVLSGSFWLSGRVFPTT